MSQRTVDVTVALFDGLSEGDLRSWHELEASLRPMINPFLNPTWVMTWYEVYVAPEDRVVLLLRAPGTGRLVGVAPLFRNDFRVGPLRAARRMLPVGSSAGAAVELPGHLSATGWHRDVNRAVVQATMAMSVDWSTISIAPEQGWFEPEHLSTGTDQGTLWQQLRSRACVVLRLAPTWEETQTALKRNVKESLRRSRNRMRRSERSFDTRRLTRFEVDQAAVDRLLELHRQRSANEKATSIHLDSYAAVESRRLMSLALPRLAVDDRASIFELLADGQVVASQLALHAPGSTYLHSSGFRPGIWDYAPVTHLVAEVVRSAVQRGERFVNFSPGPTVSKLRWSEELWVANEFAYAAGSRRSLARFVLLRGAAALSPAMAGITWTPPPSKTRRWSKGTKDWASNS